jgi:hypothetical protein
LRGEGAYDFTRQQGNLRVQFPAPGSPSVSVMSPPYGSAPVVIDHAILYEKVPGFPKPWARLEPKPDENFFDPGLVLAMLPQVSTATVTGTDTLRGTATTRYRAAVTGWAGRGRGVAGPAGTGPPGAHRTPGRSHSTWSSTTSVSRSRW